MDRADVLAEKERNAEALADYEKVIGQQPANAGCAGSSPG